MTSAKISNSLLRSFFEEATKQLEICGLKEGDREAPQELSMYRKRVLEVQRMALEQVVQDTGVTVEEMQAELKNPSRMMTMTDQLVKIAMMKFNEAARGAFARLVLHQECIWEKKTDQRSLISTGKIERKALVEFCGLCSAVVHLPCVLTHLRDGSKMFDDQEDSEEEAKEIFPQKRLERIQRMMMRAVGYDSTFGTEEVKRIFFTTAADGNEFDGDTQVHSLFANLGTNMHAAITNATMAAQQEQLSDGQTRVVSVTYSAKDVGADWDPTQSIGAPHQQSMENSEKHKQHLQMAREAAAMQQSILAELLQMEESDRDAKLKEAKEAHEDFMKRAMELPVGPERVNFMTSIDKETNRMLLMHKLWTNMLQANGGKPPKMNYKK